MPLGHPNRAVLARRMKMQQKVGQNQRGGGAKAWGRGALFSAAGRRLGAHDPSL
eukprot:SAG31_NODE_14338_length_812_cov_4.483871_2_plen_53_part_01